jgi:hypothetical protein
VTDEPSYSLDTSAFVNPWNKYYALDLAPGYWRTIPDLVRVGRVHISEEVRDELDRVDDGLAAWAKANIAQWHPLTDEVQAIVTDLMARWGRLVDVRKDRSRADPWVIATAKVNSAIVVTDEKYGSKKDPRIPIVCDDVGVRCIDVYRFVREAGIPLV